MIKLSVYEVVTGQKVATIKARRQLALKIASDVYHGKQYKKVEEDGSVSEMRFKDDSKNHK